ncbi:DNA cytosine methyltransferase [Alphaproteobacteria bacterium]|nr:DNA cytosine methyltransferase [Alphaproteobacteria bacterium]
MIDLFAGAGGLSAGLENLGLATALCVDNDDHCIETLRLNKGSNTKILKSDLFELDTTGLREIAGIENDGLLIVGGPPCQPFSKNSYWTEKGTDSKYRKLRAQGITSELPAPLENPRDDRRRFLIDVFADAVRDAKPDAFIFENVASIMHPRNRIVFENLQARLESFGYSIAVRKLMAVEYGIPQKRERVFILGMRGKTSPSFSPPKYHAGKGDRGGLLPVPKVNDVLKKIKFKSEKGIEIDGRWADALREIPPGMNYKALTAWAGHPKPLFVAETRFWNFLLKLSPNLPSWTIASQPGPWTGPFHWENRRLTTGELAAIQGFPEGYKFSGSRRERVRQIGNAVPPAFVEAVASNLIQDLMG